MEAISLGTQARNTFGKGSARKLRRDGMIPAIIYRAGTDATHVAVDPHMLKALFQHADNPNVLFALDVEGQTLNCLIKDAEKHPVTRDLLHVDFYEVDEGSLVTVEVPVEVAGKALGEALGGRVRKDRRTIRLAAKPGDIPTTIVLDVSHMQVDDSITVSDVTLPEGCSMDLDASVTLLTCLGKRAELVVESPIVETEGEGEEGEEAEAGDDAPETDED